MNRTERSPRICTRVCVCGKEIKETDEHVVAVLMRTKNLLSEPTSLRMALSHNGDSHEEKDIDAFCQMVKSLFYP